MARSRRSTSTETHTESTNNKESNNMSTTEVTFLEDLTDEEIAEAQSKTRARGVYDEALAMFLASGKRGAGIRPDNGPFEGKTVENIKSGLDNAKKRPIAPEGAADVKVVIYEDEDKNRTVRIFRTGGATESE
jgi:hypothetical protein